MFKRLLVPVDGTDLSTREIDLALELARQLGADVIGFVVEAVAPLPAAAMHLSSYARVVTVYDTRSRDHGNQLLHRFAAAAAQAQVHFNGYVVIDDDVAGAIVQAAAHYRVDMIVMITHGRSVFGELLFGSHTKEVMARSKTPLLVLR